MKEGESSNHFPPRDLELCIQILVRSLARERNAHQKRVGGMKTKVVWSPSKIFFFSVAFQNLALQTIFLSPRKIHSKMAGITPKYQSQRPIGPFIK